MTSCSSTAFDEAAQLNGHDSAWPVPRIDRHSLPSDFFKLIPQQAVRYTPFDVRVPHNAIWDFARAPDGRMFLSLCAETTIPESAVVYEFMPQTGKLEACFELGSVCLPPARAIPPSKVHTSMGFLDDGRVSMTTNTTAPARTHQAWLPDSYYAHQWEGFPGSQVLIYDPD
ncbi:MAG: hypothetical protein ACOC9P_02145, partial [bacterium]